MTTEHADNTGQSQAADLSAVIERAKHELEQMMDYNPQVMLLVNREGVVTRTNRALLDFVGLPSFRDVLGRRLDELFGVENAGAFDGFPASATEQSRRELVVNLPRGKRVLQFFVVAPTREADLHVVLIDDVTDFKAETVHIEKEHKRQAVEALVGALMHNINQPLTVIMVTARLMHMAIERGTINPEEMKRSLQEIMDLTMRVSKLLEQIRIPADFVTESYLKGMDILDLKRSSGPGLAGEPTE